jgi:hypothetical protein
VLTQCVMELTQCFASRARYTCLMILTAVLFVLEQHLEQMFIALGYTRCDACIGLVTGVGVDVGCSYAFVYLQGLGMRGFALAELTVRASRLLCWLALALGFRLWRTLFVPSFRAKRELLFSRTEVMHPPRPRLTACSCERAGPAWPNACRAASLTCVVAAAAPCLPLHRCALSSLSRRRRTLCA